MPAVDHRHIQRELGDVVIHLHTPSVLSSTAVRVQWKVMKLHLHDCLSCTQSFVKHVNGGKGQMCNFSSECKHIVCINK